MKELCDVVVAALGALHHFIGERTEAAVAERARHVAERLTGEAITVTSLAAVVTEAGVEELIEFVDMNDVAGTIREWFAELPGGVDG